jgi:hypothetical protein
MAKSTRGNGLRDPLTRRSLGVGGDGILKVQNDTVGGKLPDGS